MSNVYQDHDPNEGQGQFLKLKDGDSVKMRIMSDPAISVYKPGDKPRYNWIVFNHDKKQVQVYSAGSSVFSQIRDLTEEWGDPQEFDIKVKRTGSGMQDTSYSVNPVKESTSLPKDAETEADKIDLVKTIKGKWLKDYLEDKTLPEPKTDGLEARALEDDTAPEFGPEDVSEDS